MNNAVRDILDRTLRREPFDERAAASWLLAEIDALESTGAIADRWRARCRLARVAPPGLREELHLQAGMQLAVRPC